METLEQLRRRRETIKVSTTRLLKVIENELNKPDVNVDILEETLNQIQPKEVLILDLDRDIQLITVDPDEQDADLAATLDYQDGVIMWRTRATRKIQQERDNDRSDASSTSSRHTTLNPGQSSIRRTSQTIKLPKLSMGKFSGEPTSWPNFWNRFKTAVHENTGITKTEKFTYLNSYLEGSAIRAIQGLAISDENYDGAIDILKRRFGRKELIIQSHMNNFLNLEPVKRANDVTGLRDLHDAIEIEVRSLKAMEITTESYGTLLYQILLERIPREIIKSFHRSQLDCDETSNVDELITYLRKEVTSMERAYVLRKPELTTNNEQGNQRYQQKSSRHPGRVSSAAALTAGSESRAPVCLFCGDPTHGPSDCKTMSVQQKRDFVKEKARCFICLKERHSAKSCWKKTKGCRICKRNHHVSLCNEKSQPARADGEEASASDETTALSTISPSSLQEKPFYSRQCKPLCQTEARNHFQSEPDVS